MDKTTDISYCSIANGIVCLNGKEIFKDDFKRKESYLSDIYHTMNIQYPKFHKMDNLAKVGYLAAEILLRDTPLDNQDAKPDTGVILMNAGSSIDTDSRFQETISDSRNYFPSPSLFVYTLPNIVIGEICIRFKIQGEGIILEVPTLDTKQLLQYLNVTFTDNVFTDCLFGWIDYQNNTPEAFLAYAKKSQVAQIPHLLSIIA